MLLKHVFSVTAAILVLASHANAKHNITGFTDKLQTQFDRFRHSGVFGDDLKQTMSIFHLHNLFYEEFAASPEKNLLCAACAVVGNGVIDARRNDGASKEDLYNFARDICVGLNIQAEYICEGVIASNLDIFMYIIDNNPALTGERMCAVVLQSSGCTSDNEPTWEIEIHDGESPERASGSGEALNILHLTDIHYDPIYQEGTLANCEHPMCCQYDSGVVENEEDAAHYWTEYNKCDVSDYLLVDTLEQIVQTHKLDYVYYTGDIISHRVWATDAYNNSEDLRYVYGEFRKSFGDIPVYPIMGNHEPHPLNVWSPNNVEEEISTKWLFDLVAEEWGHWLGEECKETIRQGGFYTVLVKPGFRVVGLNSNVAYLMNWWLLYDDVDSFGQLAWLENVLYEAEQNNESVHILSHIPSAEGSAYAYWMKQFFKILVRYQNTVTGIFNGHTHKDELVVYHNEDGSPIKVVAYNGGSLTPYSGRNPNYRILKVDTDNSDVLDYDQYMFNVDEANKNRDVSPVWFKQYSFKEAYGVDSLFGEDVSALMTRMAQEPSKELMKQYLNFRNRDGPQSHEPCDENCMKSVLRDLVTPYYGHVTHADALMEHWQYDVEA